MKVIIMAGGGGTRLRPLTCDRPKPMVPIMNKPMMEHIIMLLKKHNLKDIGVTLQYMPEAIKDYFEDGSSWGVNLNYYIEDTPLGTAGSVKNASSFLDETFLVISGDALTDIDLTAAIEYHQKKGAIATLVLTSVETPLEYGVVITAQDGHITQFLEKPSWGEVFSDTVNTGIYVLEPEVLNYFEHRVKFDFSKDLFPMILEKKQPLFGYIAEGYWCDIGNLEQYRQAHYDILEGKVDVSLDETEQQPGVWMGERVKISPEAQISGPVVIGNDCEIAAGAKVKEFSVIGVGTIIEKEASIKRSICWENVYVGKRCELRGTVLCHKVRLEDGVSIFEGAVIGDETVVEKESRIKPEVKVWPYKYIESGSILKNSLIWGGKFSKNLFGRRGIRRKANQEITPGFAAELGSAYGSLLKENPRVAVSSDNWKVSRMLKLAFISGLLAAGVRVVDTGQLLTPMSRLALRKEKAAGGVHIHRSSTDNEEVIIKIFDEMGLNISKDWERKIEQTHQREDYPRKKAEATGDLVTANDYLEKYRENLIKIADTTSIEKHSPSLILAFTEPLVYSIIFPTFEKIGVKASLYEPVLETQPLLRSEIIERADEISRAMKEHKAHMGAVIDRAGEELILIDTRGRVIKEDYFTALITYILFKGNQEGTVAVPVTASGVIEKIAEEFNGRVIRTKTAPRFLMEQLNEQDLHTQFLLQYDAPAALVHIISFISREGVNLSRLVDQIPEFHLKHKQIECPWGSKGKVMRKLIEESREEEVELLDGVKVHHPEGWALILPDPEEPYYQVYGEGYNEEISESLTEMYLKKIKRMQKE